MANSDRLKRWFASNTSNGILVYVLHFSHSTFGDFWINEFGEDLTVILEDGFTNELTKFIPFKISFAQTSNSTLQQIKVNLDNIDNTLYQAIRAIPLIDMNESIKAELRFYLDDDLLGPQNTVPIRLEVDKIDAKGSSLQINLVAPNLRDVRKFLRYNPNRFPTLYTFFR